MSAWGNENFSVPFLRPVLPSSLPSFLLSFPPLSLSLSLSLSPGKMVFQLHVLSNRRIASGGRPPGTPALFNRGHASTGATAGDLEADLQGDTFRFAQ